MQYIPWARAEAGVKEGKIDILPNTWLTHEREKYLAYSTPYAVNQLKFIMKNGDTFEFDNLESLTGKTVGIVRGYGYGDDFVNAQNFKREEANNLITNIKKLIKDRIDLTLEDEIVARVRISQESPDLLQNITFSKNALSTNDLYVTCGLANPRHKEIIEAFNKGLKIIKSNGTYAKIMEKYGITQN